jgi:ribonuclease D
MTPDTDELLPPYDGIKMAAVRLVKTERDASEALAALSAMDVIGFDTESKPTFLKGEVSTGPHLVQLATDDAAFLFQIGAAPVSEGFSLALKSVLESRTILKVGFGLQDDVKRLHAKLGIETSNVLDLSTALRKGERNTLGAKTAVAKFFGQKLQKSKKITTTNWARPRLSEKQILYAADDAHVALKVYRHWRKVQTATA